jgi:hypothetical protein
MRLFQRTFQRQVAPFWDPAWPTPRAELDRAASASVENRLRRAVRAHLWLRNALESGAITYAVLVFGTDPA